MGGRTPEDRFRSLTDLKWGEFEMMGFGDVGADDKKLQFDLTEGARAVSDACPALCFVFSCHATRLITY